MKNIALLCALTCALSWGQASSPAGITASNPIATVNNGKLRGSLTSDGVAVFKAIPFAQPPVGNLRWHEPLPAKAWTGVRDATAFSPACYQSGHLNATSSEDCLYLNVWTPKWPMKSPAAVMVWIHGGGNTAGAGVEPLFNGESLARHGVVLVTVNYRLGPFGFFAHPELTKESPHHVSGNYALLDQIEALRWVHDNIAKFGGNPANVTIFGESAGSMDVNTLMTSPLSKGLFARVIAESGAAGDAQSLAEAEKQGQALAAKLNLTGPVLEKLRALSSEEVLKASTQGPASGGGMLGVNVDGYVLPESPAKAFELGHELRIPLMLGNNSQELQKPFGPMGSDLRETVSKRFGPLADRALALYGLTGTAEPQPDPEFGTAGAQWATDSTFRCASVEQLVWHAAAGNTAYEFQFSRTVHGQEAQGAPHAAEVPFVFNTLPVWQEMRHYNDTDKQASEEIEQYWTNFAKTGDPNGGKLTQWPRFDPSARTYLDFTDNGATAKQGLRRQVCDLYMENRKRQAAQ